MNSKLHQQLPNRARRAFLKKSSLALMGLAGTGIPGFSWATRGDTLHIRNYNDVTSLDPVSSVSGAEGFIFAAIYQNILQFASGDSWDTRLDAAEWFEQRDATHYDFRLKPGQMFNNGYGEMTADDVKFSFERMVDPAMYALNLPDMGPLDHVDVHDRYSGTFVLRSPYAAFIPIALAGPSGAIMSRKAVTAVGGRFTTKPPCGSGPYTFKSWQAQRKTVLERNPLWVGEEAAFSELHIYAMGDDKAGEMAFEAGQLDWSQISVETVGPFEKAMPPDSKLLVLPSGRNYWLGMNRENPALADIRIRKAVQYAVDVEAVLEAAWFGLAKVSNGPVPEGMIGHRARALIPPRGDPDKARALLREACSRLPASARWFAPASRRSLASDSAARYAPRQIGRLTETMAISGSLPLSGVPGLRASRVSPVLRLQAGSE